jgi:hypothetical protein
MVRIHLPGPINFEEEEMESGSIRSTFSCVLSFVSPYHCIMHFLKIRAHGGQKKNNAKSVPKPTIVAFKQPPN